MGVVRRCVKGIKDYSLKGEHKPLVERRGAKGTMIWTLKDEHKPLLERNRSLN